ncbi:MAG: AAA family ATPase [Nitrospirae bacterium]|nr:AAA family ATPase [Nitrospirota bacterium]
MRQLAKSQGWEVKERNGQLNAKWCPFCSDNDWHFYLDEAKNAFFCHKCRQGGYKPQILRHLGLQQEKVQAVKSFDEAVGVTKVIGKPKEGKAYELHSAITVNTRDYLTSRGINAESIKQFQLGTLIENGREWLSFPYIKDGECVNIKYRSIPPAQKEFKRTTGGESCLFNHDCIAENDEIIITEGEFDAVTLWQHGYKNVVSIPNGVNNFAPEWIDQLSGLKKIYIWYDNDDKGKPEAVKIAKRLGINRTYIVQFHDVKDANEYFRLFDVLPLQDAYRLEVEGIVSFYQVAMRSVLNETIENDIITPWNNVNKLIGGMKSGQLTALLATPKTGKTTFALNIASYNAKNGRPVLFYCLEMTPLQLAQKVIEKECLRPFSELTQAVVEKKKSTLQAMPLYFTLNHGALNLDKVLETMRFATQRYGIELIVFDNLHFLSRSETHSEQELSNASKSFKLLANELDVPIILITQPRKNSGAIISSADIKGTSSIHADVDQVIILHRKKTKASLEEETESAFEPRTLVRLDASRYMPGGDAFLHFESAVSNFMQIAPDR